MKLLSSVLVLGLIGFTVPVFAESPVTSTSGDIYSAILLTPELDIETIVLSETLPWIDTVDFLKIPSGSPVPSCQDTCISYPVSHIFPMQR